jgi:hypothetical protein
LVVAAALVSARQRRPQHSSKRKTTAVSSILPLIPCGKVRETRILGMGVVDAASFEVIGVVPVHSDGQRSRLQPSQGQPQHQVAVLSLSSNLVDHVHLARDLSFASMVPEVPACMVFDDMPLRDNDTADVIWDEEMQHMFDQHGLLKELAHSREHMSGAENTPSAELVISQVVWDEEFATSGAIQWNALHGCYLG